MWILCIFPFHSVYRNTDHLHPTNQRHASISWHGDERIMGVTESVMGDCNSAFPTFNPRSRNHFLSLSFFHCLMNITSFQQWYHIFLRSFAHQRNQLLLSEESFINTIFNTVITLPTGVLSFTEWSIHLTSYLYSHDVIETIAITTNRQYTLEYT